MASDRAWSTPAADEPQPVKQRGFDLIRDPLLNKGTAFTPEERRELGLEGLLPSRVNSLDQQVYRNVQQLSAHRDPLDRYVMLADLQDRNEQLFYRVLIDHLETFMPVVYTPTVGLATREFSHVEGYEDHSVQMLFTWDDGENLTGVIILEDRDRRGIRDRPGSHEQICKQRRGGERCGDGPLPNPARPDRCPEPGRAHIPVDFFGIRSRMARPLLLDARIDSPLYLCRNRFPRVRQPSNCGAARRPLGSHSMSKRSWSTTDSCGLTAR